MTVLRKAASLDVSGLGCIRGGRVLFRDLSFAVAAGQALVVTGRNGTGKSTLLRSLAGMQPWRAGQMSWCGRQISPQHADYQQQLAYLGHQTGMSDVLSGLENLRFALTTMNMPWEESRVQAVLRSLALHEVAPRLFGRLSQGQRRRFGLARVLLSQRLLWLLDEPGTALDDQGGQWLTQALTAHLAEGGMAVVASHQPLALPATSLRSLVLSSNGDGQAAMCASITEQVTAC